MDLLKLLDIKVVRVTPGQTIIEMPVVDKVKQPFGILHGGVNSVLAETAASLAANAFLKAPKVAVGVNINTQHLKSVSTGTLQALATPLQLGHQLLRYQVLTRLKGESEVTSISTVTLIAKTLIDPHTS